MTALRQTGLVACLGVAFAAGSLPAMASSVTWLIDLPMLPSGTIAAGPGNQIFACQPSSTADTCYVVAPAVGGGYGITTIYTAAPNPHRAQTVVSSPLPDAAGNFVVGVHTHALVRVVPTPDGSVPWTGTQLARKIAMVSSNFVQDANGILYSTTSGGVVLSVTASKKTPGAWIMKTLTTVAVTAPIWVEAVDAAGNLYLRSDQGDYGNYGGQASYYKVSPPATQGGAWTSQMIWTGMNYGFGPVAVDSHGNLFATDFAGGNGSGSEYAGGGVVELSPPATPGDPYVRTKLTDFLATASYGPEGPVAIDAQGNVYGSNIEGQMYAGIGGGVWQLSPPSSPGGGWTLTTLANFTEFDPRGAYPVGGVTRAADGTLYVLMSSSSTGSPSGAIVAVTP